jgi:16S rRNA (cytidine1402-2'-O)-methyltransferase
MRRHEIRTPLKSFHRFNEVSREESIIEDLKAGRRIGVISDAGTPGIADPGEKLVRRCIAEKIAVTAIPGACAAITALICSGFTTLPFQCVGFLPRQEGELQQLLLDLLQYRGTSLCYESPRRLIGVLQILQKLCPKRPLAFARELTKKFEEVCYGIAQELIDEWQDREIKGEVVLIISGKTEKDSLSWELLSPVEHVAWLEENYQISRKEAIKLAAELRGVPKRELYQNLLNK